MTFNPQPSSTTYISTIFKISNGTSETTRNAEIYTVMQKKTTVDTDRTASSIFELTQSTLAEPNCIYPGYLLFIVTRFERFYSNHHHESGSQED